VPLLCSDEALAQTRHKGERLAEADGLCVDESDLFHVEAMVARSLRHRKQDRQEDESPGDHVEGAGLVLDKPPKGQAADTDRDRSEKDIPRETGLVRIEWSPLPNVMPRSANQTVKVGGKIEENSHEGAQLEYGGVRCARIFPSEQGRDDP